VRIVTVARKPCVESSTTANVLVHSCGALHIDVCRVGSSGGTTRSHQAEYPLHDDGTEDRSQHWARTGHAVAEIPAGRWPPNVILSHRPGCRRGGTKSVKSGGHYPAARPSGSQVSGPAGHKGQTELVERHTTGEIVDVWDCERGCPVASMDGQTGVLTSGSGTVKRSSGTDRRGNKGAAYGAESRPDGTPMIFYGDSGGASRFFRQVTP
jgi:hypothetical protein